MYIHTHAPMSITAVVIEGHQKKSHYLETKIY